MTAQSNHAAHVAALALIVTVATQIVYIVVSNGGGEPPRDIIWSIEVTGFAVLAIAGLAMLPARPSIGAAIAVGGMLNTIQAGIGLAMFAPLMEAGETTAPVFEAVLSMAFLLYFAAKLALGVAAVAAAWALRKASGKGKTAGALSGLAGMAAVILATAAIFPATELTFPAGGAGTAAALFLALALLAMKEHSREPGRNAG